MWLSQFAGHKCYFTSLINYQVWLAASQRTAGDQFAVPQMFQENAPHSLILTHYVDFLYSKGMFYHPQHQIKGISHWQDLCWFVEKWISSAWYASWCMHITITNDLSVLQSTLEAQNLTNQMQLYYASQRADLYAMVREFNHNPQNFDYKQLIGQFNTLSL